MESIVHISGIALHIGEPGKERIVQRCSVCGAKLADNLNVAMPLNSDNSVPEFPTWPVGRLIEVETGNPIRYSLLIDTEQLPKNSCIDLA